jgi:aldehyde:ferredoxin oxidoreductase
MTLRVLRVRLDSSTHQPETVPASVEQAFLGGRGLATWLLTYWLPPGAGPLSRANLLIFSAGPLSGSSLPATSGFVVSTRSPLTGAIAHSWAQGSWGAALRRCGYDALAIDGQSVDWCYVRIDGPDVSIEPAHELLGLDTMNTVAALRNQLGAEYQIVCVGPAGEAGVAYSAIVAEGAYTAEPAGTGAVMAHKRVKAIAVRNGAPRNFADMARAEAVFDTIKQRINTSEIASGIRQFSSNYYLPYAKEWGALTGRNGQEGRITHLNAITRTTFAQRGKRAALGCEGCPLPCYYHYIRRDGEPVACPELEAVAGFGGRCGIASPDALILANDRCLRLGLDVVATSNALAFMAECQQEGLSRAGTLAWSDDDAMLAAIERLGQRQEKRDVLSLGVGEMQEVFFGSAAFAPHVKGLAMPALDPRALHEIALAIATSPIGGDYRYAMAYEEMLPEPPPWLPDEPSHPQAIKGKVSRLIWHERFAAALDSTGLCRRLALMAYQVTPSELTELLTAVLGRSFTGAELALIGERVITLERLFWLRYGTTGGSDKLPSRWRETPLTDGRAAGHLPAMDDLLPEYYRRHGWDSQGRPTEKRLVELGITVSE